VGPYLERRIVYEGSDEDDVLVGPALRPYLLTAGRFDADAASVSIETQVVTTDQGWQELARIPFESGSIVRLCEEPMSVAEIGARLSLHLGVVADPGRRPQPRAALPSTSPTSTPQYTSITLRRVIHGLRAIREPSTRQRSDRRPPLPVKIVIAGGFGVGRRPRSPASPTSPR